MLEEPINSSGIGYSAWNVYTSIDLPSFRFLPRRAIHSGHLEAFFFPFNPGELRGGLLWDLVHRIYEHAKKSIPTIIVTGGIARETRW